MVSGGEFHTGAARLSAWAALHAGAGAVTIAGGRAALRIHAAHVSAIMLAAADSPAEFTDALAVGTLRAVVIGPALGLDATADAKLDAVLATAPPVVVDGDAITLLSRRAPVPLDHSVLTPHEGEFARLFGYHGDREERASRAAGATGAVVVLKGRHTVIAAPDGRLAVNRTGGVALATAGSGDVLAGIIGSHLAQGMPRFEAACAAVWLHGVTGDRLGVGLNAEQLAHAVRPLAVQLAELLRAVHAPRINGDRP